MATTVITTGGFSFQDIPTPDRSLPPSILHAEDEVTGHMANIDITNNALDGAHLVLRGDLPVGHHYIRCESQAEEEKFTIDKFGAVVCNAVVLPIIGDVQTEIQINSQIVGLNTNAISENFNHIGSNDGDILLLQQRVGEPTPLNTAGALVKRAAAGAETEIDQISCSQLSALGTNPGIAVYGQGRFDWVALNSNGTLMHTSEDPVVYRFGRDTENLNDFSGAGDGIHFQREDNELLMQVSKGTPTIRIDGQKNVGINYLEVIDETQNTVFGITKTGSLVGTHKTAVDLHLGRTTTLESWMVAASADIVDLEDDIDTLTIADIHNVKIVGNQNITGLKTFEDIQLTGSLVPAPNYEFIATIGSKDKPMSSINVRVLETGPDSMWLGNFMHFNTDDSKCRIQVRNKTIPQYLQTNGVVESDYTALGFASNTATLTHIKDVSASKGLSETLSVLFPSSNYSVDFQSDTTFDQIQINPTNTTGGAGLIITADGELQAQIFLHGNSTRGGGSLVFSEGGQYDVKSVVYASANKEQLQLISYDTNGIGFRHVTQDVICEIRNDHLIVLPDMNLTFEDTGLINLYQNSDGSLANFMKLHKSGSQKYLELGSDVHLRYGSGVDISSQIATERARIDGILNLSQSDLDTLREIQDEFQAQDSSITATVVALQNTHASEISAEQTARIAGDDALSATVTTNKGLFNTEKTATATDRALIRTQFAAADTGISNTVTTNKGLFDTEQTDSATDRALIRAQYVAADALRYTKTEADAITDLLAPLASPIFTTKINTPEVASLTSHLKLRSVATNDINLYCNNQETLQFTRSGTEVRYQAHGGSGQHRFMNQVFVNSGVSIASGSQYQVNGTQIAASDLSDVYTKTEVDAANTTQDGLISTNTSKVGISSQQSTDISTNNDKTGITSGQASAIVTNTAKTGISSQQASDISTNNDKTGITSGQASAIVTNTSKTGISSQQASDISTNNDKTGITSGQASAIVTNTAKTGISSQQASDISTNNDKTGITSGQASAIVTNTSKTGISSQQASDISTNNSKTGITSQQTSDITTNNAKVSYPGLASADLTGSVGIGNPLKASGLGLTVHQSGEAESGISIYATGGSDSVLNLMENKGDFGHATNGGTGFRVMYDGGTNQFLIRSADDDTVNTRLSIERDSGTVGMGNLEISGDVGFYGETATQQPEAESTTIGFTANSGTALNFSTTFSGGVGSEAYTVGDIVRCLKELGLIKS